MNRIFRLAAPLLAVSLLACTTASTEPRDLQVAAPSATVALGETFRAGRKTVTPVAIVEESRCPSDVQCIQAGTVRLSVKISGQAAPVIIGLQSPAAVGGRWLHLVAVSPYPRQAAPIAPRDYRFTFRVEPGPSRP